MNKFFYFLFFSLFSIFAFSQTTKIKHIEIVSDSAKIDSAILLNKEDVDVINTIFLKKEKLESLVEIKDSIIYHYEIKDSIKQNIIFSQDSIIKNSMKLLLDTKIVLQENSKIIIKQQENIEKQKKWKKIWSSTSGGLAAILIIILCL